MLNAMDPAPQPPDQNPNAQASLFSGQHSINGQPDYDTLWYRGKSLDEPPDITQDDITPEVTVPRWAYFAQGFLAGVLTIVCIAVILVAIVWWTMKFGDALTRGDTVGFVLLVAELAIGAGIVGGLMHWARSISHD